MKFRLCAAALAFAFATPALAHQGFLPREEVIHNTPEWKGERFPDGRPKVPDALLDRMKGVTLEEAWATLRSQGYEQQYEDGWFTLYPDKILVGRALTSTWIPGRLDLQKVIEADGKVDGRKGGPNAWPVDMLQQRDVYVSDHFGLKVGGPSIGDNVGNAIYARSGNGIVYDGAVRDVNGLKELPNFIAFVRAYDPSHHFGRIGDEGRPVNSTMTAINSPTRIGHAAAMPGDAASMMDTCRRRCPGWHRSGRSRSGPGDQCRSTSVLHVLVPAQTRLGDRRLADLKTTNAHHVILPPHRVPFVDVTAADSRTHHRALPTGR